MSTYNQIIKSFSDFAEAHLMIHSYFDGKSWEFQVSESTHPSMVVSPTSGMIENGASTVTFNISFLDLLANGMDNLQEIYSDTRQMAEDFVATYSGQGRYDFWIQDGMASIEAVEATLDDNLAGWIMDVTFIVPFGGSRCGLPISE